MAKMTRVAFDEALERVAELEAVLSNVRSVADDCGHVEWTVVEYPNATVCLDVVGNVTSVDFHEDGWSVFSA